MKEEISKVFRYLVREWLAFAIIFGVIAVAFGDWKLLGWGILGAIAGKAWRGE